jgi:TetR/AcrR family fatty acid metabolism transcriptional regulator
VKRSIPKSKILKAALSLFSSKGYAETKMSAIAKSAGMSVGALYLRFKNKEELCLELINDQTKKFREHIDSLVTSKKDPLQILRAYITLNLEFAFKKQQLLSIFVSEYKLPFIQPLKKNFFDSQQKILREVLNRGVKEKLFRPMDTKEIALMIFAGVRGTVMMKLVFGVGDANTMSNSLFKLVLNGIRKDMP